jgi:hypothetical protein
VFEFGVTWFMYVIVVLLILFLNLQWIEEESLMCHQCQRNDKGRVVRCTKCKRKRYCVCCINNWYNFIYFCFNLFDLLLSCISYYLVLLNVTYSVDVRNIIFVGYLDKISMLKIFINTIGFTDDEILTGVCFCCLIKVSSLERR